MTYLLLVLSLAVAWGYHCWRAVRAYKAGYDRGSEDAVERMSRW